MLLLSLRPGAINSLHFRMLFPFARAFQCLRPTAAAMRHFVGSFLGFKNPVDAPRFPDFSAVLPESNRQTRETRGSEGSRFHDAGSYNGDAQEISLKLKKKVVR